MCNPLQTVVTSFRDGAFRIIPWHSWTVPHASTTAGKYQPLFSIRWSAATLFVRNLWLPEKYMHCVGLIAVPSCSPNLMPPDFIVWNALRTVLIFSSPHALLT